MAIAPVQAWLLARWSAVLLAAACAGQRVPPAPADAPARSEAIYVRGADGTRAWNQETLQHLGFPEGAPLPVLRGEQLGAMSDPHILAHLRIADSLQMLLSSRGEQWGRNAGVRELARLLAQEHLLHWQMEGFLAQLPGSPPASAPFDTLDVALMRRLLPVLDDLGADTSSAGATARFEGAYIGLQVLVHQHAHAELSVLRSTARARWMRQIIDQGLATASAHLGYVRTTARQLGITLPDDPATVAGPVGGSDPARPRER